MGELIPELRAALGAARAWLEELSEEGVERVDPVSLPAAGPPARVEAIRPADPEPVRSRAGAAAHETLLGSAPTPLPPASSRDRFAEAPGWGEAPSLEAVRDALGECTRCRLHEGRSRIVFGDGNPEAELMFVGEGPGAEEDRQGLPFVGRAGELLTAMIEKGLGVPRSEVYICNIVKCRPPGNRDPAAEEAATCQPFLDGQIEAVRPRVIVSLGKPATRLLLGREVAITRLRGQWQQYRGIPVMPTFHPAYVLRQYTPENRRAVWDDLRAALSRARGQA